jgi:hypothetical protein
MNTVVLTKPDDDRLRSEHEAWIKIHFMNKLVMCKTEMFLSNWERNVTKIIEV